MRKRKCLTRIRLYRFQGYADETIWFKDTTNAIVGESDSGKSSITRALYWVLYNRPVRLGINNEFASYNETHVFVSVTFNDGTTITRGRRNDENYYILDAVDMETKKKERKVFKGFGFEVPEEIIKAHGMPRLDLGDNDQISLNISQQLDPIFMFDDSASRKAKMLGQLSGADRLDGGIGVLGSWQKKSLSNKKDLLAKIKSVSEDIEKYNFIEDAEEALILLENILNIMKDDSQLKSKVSEALSSLLDLELAKETLLSILLHEPNLLDLDPIIADLESSIAEKSRLEGLLSSYDELSHGKIEVESLLKHEELLSVSDNLITDALTKMKLREQIELALSEYKLLVSELNKSELLVNSSCKLDALNPILNSIGDKLHLRDEIVKLINQLNELQTRRDFLEGLLEITNSDLADIVDMYNETMQSLDICPLCEQQIHGGYKSVK